MRRTLWKAVVLVLAGAFVPALHATVRSESLEGLRLSIFTEHLLAYARSKLAPGEGGMASINLFLEGTGLEGSDVAILTLVLRQDAEFSRDQLERWQDERQRATRAGRESLFEGVSDAFVLERAEFVGGALGRLLRERQPDPQKAGTILRQILHRWGRAGSVSTASGDGVSYEELERQARQFEAGFEREFGAPLQALVRSLDEKR